MGMPWTAKAILHFHVIVSTTQQDPTVKDVTALTTTFPGRSLMEIGPLNAKVITTKANNNQVQFSSA